MLKVECTSTKTNLPPYLHSYTQEQEYQAAVCGTCTSQNKIPSYMSCIGIHVQQSHCINKQERYNCVLLACCRIESWICQQKQTANERQVSPICVAILMLQSRACAIRNTYAYYIPYCMYTVHYTYIRVRTHICNENANAMLLNWRTYT